MVDVQDSRRITLTGCVRLDDGNCWGHTDCLSADIARTGSANDRGLKDVGRREDLEPGEVRHGRVPVSLRLAVCDPNDHSEGHLTRAAEVTVGVSHFVS